MERRGETRTTRRPATTTQRHKEPFRTTTAQHGTLPKQREIQTTTQTHSRQQHQHNKFLKYLNTQENNKYQFSPTWASAVCSAICPTSNEYPRLITLQFWIHEYYYENKKRFQQLWFSFDCWYLVRFTRSSIDFYLFLCLGVRFR